LEWGQWKSKLVVAGIHKEPPKLYSDLSYVWDAFMALSLTRTGFCPISFSEIESWLNINCIFNATRRQEVTHLIRIMDIEYISFLRKKYAKS
jgi:hypothetical protein